MIFLMVLTHNGHTHSYVQQKQNDGLTNNPPNNPYTWTNERKKNNEKQKPRKELKRREKKETIHTELTMHMYIFWIG